MRYLRLALAALFLATVSQVQAQVFVGSYQVDQGPFWSTVPPVYSALDAAALLFGGSPTDYSISTVDNNPMNINHMGWYSEIFIAGGHLHAEGYTAGGTDGLYNEPGDASAYVQDNAVGAQFTNFVFRNGAQEVPEASAGVMIVALLASGGGLLIRRKRRS